MNLNLSADQRRAVDVAEKVVSGALAPGELKDADWALLMLAAGMHRADQPVRLVACKVLTNLAHGRGYFSSVGPMKRGRPVPREDVDPAAADGIPADGAGGALEIASPEPVAAMKVAVAVRPERQEATSPRSGKTPRIRPTAPLVMIVDDHREIREALERVLRKSGNNTLTEPSGEAAVADARRFRPDLIILDWMMPDLDGLSVMRELRRDPTTSRIPVVMCTCRDEPSAVAAARAAGVCDYWVKGLVDHLAVGERVSGLLNDRATRVA